MLGIRTTKVATGRFSTNLRPRVKFMCVLGVRAVNHTAPDTGYQSNIFPAPFRSFGSFSGVLARRESVPVSLIHGKRHKILYYLIHEKR